MTWKNKTTKKSITGGPHIPPCCSLETSACSSECQHRSQRASSWSGLWHWKRCANIHTAQSTSLRKGELCEPHTHTCTRLQSVLRPRLHCKRHPHLRCPKRTNTHRLTLVTVSRSGLGWNMVPHQWPLNTHLSVGFHLVSFLPCCVLIAPWWLGVV